MKSPFLHLTSTMGVCLVLAMSCAPVALSAQEARQSSAAPSKTTQTSESKQRDDIHIVNGTLELTPLKGRIDVNALFGPGDPVGVSATLGHLVDVLRALHPDENIVMPPNLSALRIGDLKLRATDLEEELHALSIASGRQFVAGRAGPSLLEIRGEPPRRSVEVFNLSGYLQSHSSTNVENVEKIIGTTLETMNREQAVFQFHPGANLLVVIGSPETIDVARKVVNALPGQQSAASNPSVK